MEKTPKCYNATTSLPASDADGAPSTWTGHADEAAAPVRWWWRPVPSSRFYRPVRVPDSKKPHLGATCEIGEIRGRRRRVTCGHGLGHADAAATDGGLALSRASAVAVVDAVVEDYPGTRIYEREMSRDVCWARVGWVMTWVALFLPKSKYNIRKESF